jgi:CRP-like cAMP-binding protein
MLNGADIAQQLIFTLSRFAKLDAADCEAIRALTLEEREITASAYINREGRQPRRCAFVLDGFVFRQKLTVAGQRAIVGLQVPGDFVDLQNLYLDESDHDAVTLTRVLIADLAIAELCHLAEARPLIRRAMWISGLIEASLFREWLLNVGRRDARERVAHLLCEISVRLESAGRARELSYDLPMTHEQIGDALGLTAVHINRVLKGLEKDGLIRRQKREVTINDWQQLRRVADFNERYLHFGAAG